MSVIHVIRTGSGWVPADTDAQETHAKQKTGSVCSADFKQVRNYKFLKKYMALINLAFDYWETGDQEYKGAKVAKNKTRFRHDAQILAGYGEPEWNIRGEMRMEPKSISFAGMDEETFGKLFDSVLAVLLNRVLHAKGFTAESINDVVAQMEEFA